MRAKNSSYAWSLVNCKDSISDSRFMIFDVLIQHWSFNIILFAKNEPVILDVHFPCQCRSLLLFFFWYCLTFFDDSLKWWAISKISSFSSFLGESDNVFTLFVESSKIKLKLVISPSYSSPSPIKALKYQQCIGAFVCKLSLSIWFFGEVVKDNRNRLWLLEFQTAAPLNLPEKWQWSLIIGFSSSSSKNSFSQVTCFGVLEIRGIFTCRDNPDGYGRYFLHLSQDEWRIILQDLNLQSFCVSRLASYQTNLSLSRLQRRGDILKARVSHIHL